jgi:hypothetical protein
MIDTHVIGFCGKAGCGKGTVSNIIKDIYPTVKIFPMAAELKRIATEEFGWDGEKDDKGRKLLQRLGTDCGRMYGGENFWVDKWQATVDNWRNNNVMWNRPYDPIVICDDVRFDNEAEHIKSIGGNIVHIVGRAYDMGDNNNHASEKGINCDLIDYTLCNSGSIEGLQRRVESILVNLGIGRNRD